MSLAQTQIAIIGGGLGGCSAAITLSRAGHAVALFESGTLPRHRVCGEFLSPDSRAILKRLGVDKEMDAAGARPVNTARFLCGGQSAEFHLGQAAGLSLSRWALDPILWEAALRAGAQGHLGAKVRDVGRDGDGFAFQVGRKQWRAGAVIYAVGRAGAPKTASATFCGFKAHFSGVQIAPGVVEMHLFRGGYCGLTRVEGEATNMALLVDYPALQKRPPAIFWRDLLASQRVLRQRFARARQVSDWQTTARVSFERFRPVGGESSRTDDQLPDGVLCVGDAAGYIHPLTGDGMAMALRAGELAAAVAGLGWGTDEAARLYQAAWEREFGSRLQLAARLHPLALQPHLAQPILPLLRCSSPLRKLLVRGTRGAFD